MKSNKTKAKTNKRGVLVLAMLLITALVIPQAAIGQNPDTAQKSANSSAVLDAAQDAAAETASNENAQTESSLENTGGGGARLI